ASVWPRSSHARSKGLESELDNVFQRFAEFRNGGFEDEAMARRRENDAYRRLVVHVAALSHRVDLRQAVRRSSQTRTTTDQNVRVGVGPWKSSRRHRSDILDRARGVRGRTLRAYHHRAKAAPLVPGRYHRDH